MFETIIGNEKVKQYLRQTIAQQKILHSYLFTGIEGIGKKKLAEEYAKSILCETKSACGKCKSCKEFETKNHPDYKKIETEENSIKIDQIRELQRKILEKPITSKNKIYIINDAEKMTIDAQNCLLKTLEEPPEYVTLILITSNESKIIPTIKSRCTKINFKPIEDEEIKKYLEEKENFINITKEELNKYSGSIKKAIEIKNEKEIVEEIEKYFKNIEKYSIIDVLGKIECLYKRKEKITEMLEYINMILIEKAPKEPKYIKYIETVEKAKQKVKNSSNYDMTIDYLLMNIF